MAKRVTKKTSISAKLAAWRVWFQATFLLVWLDPLMLRMHTVCSPVFHCYSCPLALFACPIGVVANFSAIHVFPFMTIGIVGITGALFGGLICGWVCPFGFFQDLVGRIPTPKFAIPAFFGYARYAVLAILVLAVPYMFGEAHPLFFCRLCPAGALEAAFPNTIQLALAGEEVVWPTAAKTTVFVIVLGAMLFTWRPWCRVLCPLGAIFSVCNFFSLIFLRVHKEDCTECGLCEKACRYGPGPLRKSVDLQCVRCLDCTQCDQVGVATVLSRSARAEQESELVTLDVAPSSSDPIDR